MSFPKPGKLLQLGVRQPHSVRAHQPADVLEARDGVEHATRGVPVETERQRLTAALVGEGLIFLVHRDAEDAGRRRILHDHLVAQLFPDRLDSDSGKVRNSMYARPSEWPAARADVSVLTKNL